MVVAAERAEPLAIVVGCNSMFRQLADPVHLGRSGVSATMELFADTGGGEGRAWPCHFNRMTLAALGGKTELPKGHDSGTNLGRGGKASFLNQDA